VKTVADGSMFAAGLAAGGTALGAGVANASTPDEVSGSGTASHDGILCVVPDTGWVIFYHDSGCGGSYQGWTRCGDHNFTGSMYRQASSYEDRQTGGAYTQVFDGAGLAFYTHPWTGVRDVALWENDRSEWARLVC
jgi:hypothetical protein